MTRRVRLSPRARSDLDAIWNDTATRWGVDQAEAYVRQISRHLEMLAANPKLGRACPEIRATYHRLAAGSHVIFYRPAKGDVDVIRILHRRMEFGRHV